MATLTNQKQKDVKIYDVLTKYADDKLFAMTNKLEIDKLVFEKRTKGSIIFYDTKDNLLTKTGILLYKTFEDGAYYFKIEKLNFLPRVFRLRTDNVFSHKIEAKDTPKSQSFYLINGITSLFTTQFSIDLENIVKVAIPIMEITFTGEQFKGFKGNGFKCAIEFQKVKYKNFITKKKYQNLEMTVSHTSPKQFEKDFTKFLNLLEKYCKDIYVKDENRFEYGQRITRFIPKVPKKKLKKEEKRNKVENRIED